MWETKCCARLLMKFVVEIEVLLVLKCWKTKKLSLLGVSFLYRPCNVTCDRIMEGILKYSRKLRLILFYSRNSFCSYGHICCCCDASSYLELVLSKARLCNFIGIMILLLSILRRTSYVGIKLYGVGMLCEYSLVSQIINLLQLQ